MWYHLLHSSFHCILDSGLSNSLRIALNWLHLPIIEVSLTIYLDARILLISHFQHDFLLSQKGTGKWTAISALEFGIPVTLIGMHLHFN